MLLHIQAKQRRPLVQIASTSGAQSQIPQHFSTASPTKAESSSVNESLLHHFHKQELRMAEMSADIDFLAQQEVSTRHVVFQNSYIIKQMCCGCFDPNILYIKCGQK